MTRWRIDFADGGEARSVMARDESEALRMARMVWPKRVATTATPT